MTIILVTLRKKAYFPYSFLDGQENSTPHFLHVAWFGKTLTGKIDISEQQYNEEVQIYNSLDSNNFGDYYDAYLKIDVFVLADLFEKFRCLYGKCII